MLNMNAVKMLKRLHLKKLRKELKHGRVTDEQVRAVEEMSDEEYEEYAERVYRNKGRR